METVQTNGPWNKGKLVGQKAPLKLKDILAIRIHFQLDKRIREFRKPRRERYAGNGPVGAIHRDQTAKAGS